MNTDLRSEHKVIMVSRDYLEVFGIEEVDSYTDSAVVAVSSMGNVSVEGEDIRIESFSSETGKLVIRGKLDGFFYFSGDNGKRRPFFSRFRRS